VSSSMTAYGEPSQSQKALAAVPESREVAEIQAAMTIAQRFPRDVETCKAKILKECERVELAEVAEYEYPRGGTEISGASIRLAEVLAINWKNLKCDTRELDNTGGKSVVETRAWDLENNVQSSKSFTVSHRRSTRSGGYDLTDPRDIYETVANNASRRLRACILAVIPGDVIQAARAKCEDTLSKSILNLPEAIDNAVRAFERFGITPEMIEKTLGRSLQAATKRNVIRLRRIYASLIDGIGKPEQFFDMSKISPQVREEIQRNHNDYLRERLSKRSGSKPAVAHQQQPEDNYDAEPPHEEPPAEQPTKRPSLDRAEKDRKSDDLRNRI
jgi:hypothetical protein